MHRGEVKENLQDYKGAIDDYSNAIKLDPSHIEAKFNRALSKYNLKDYLGAKDDFTLVITQNSKRADAYFYRADTNLKLKDIVNACSDWGIAGDLGMVEAYAEIKTNCK